MKRSSLRRSSELEWSHGFGAGNEGVILHSISCRSKNGASHRKKGGHVTPKWELWSARKRILCLRRLTFAISADWISF